MVITQQQRQIGGRARGGERHRPDAQILNALKARGMAVGVGGQHHLGAASQRLGADSVGVSDDELRPIPGLAQHIGTAADLALLLCDHHGASLIVTAGHTASIEEFFDRSRQRTNPSTFLTRLKVGEKLVDAKAVATLYRSRVSGGAIALLVLAMLIAVIAALWVSRADVAVLDWIADYWNRFSLWVQGWVT